ncbi:MAG: hypothetical protein QG594_415 [Bacteroidota bacterium]|nr:hypothetical protein [Bacteroidota bacterium]
MTKITIQHKVLKIEHMKIEGIIKAPHYFLVHFDERCVRLDGASLTGKPYPIICDNVAVNVYGFRTQKEADEFDPLILRRYAIGSHHQNEFWPGDDKEVLMQEIENDEHIKSGVYTLSTRPLLRGVIEDLPSCERMHKDPDGQLLCGKPINEYSDGCYGGCVLQGFEQDEEFHDGFRCPIHEYWNKRPSKIETED